MISGRSARNEPNTQASTIVAASAPSASSLSTLEWAAEAPLVDNALSPVLWTAAPGTAVLAAAESWLSTLAGRSVPARGG